MWEKWKRKMKWEEIKLVGIKYKIGWGLEAEAICFLISYLFYQSVIAFILLQPISLYFFWMQVRKNEQKRINDIKQEFKEGLGCLIANLRAGYSLENAFRQAKKELERIYSAKSLVVQEFDYIVKQQDLKIPIEDLLTLMSEHLNIYEVKQFSSMVSLGKRTGGDLVHIMSKTAEHIGQIQEVEEEISTLIAGKKMEQNVMCALPFFIIGYVSITNPNYYENMYHSLFGVLFMTGMLLLILIAKVIGDKLIRIEV